MDFSRATVAPKGRNKYGQYISMKDVSVKSTQYVYNGNASTGGNTGNSDDPPIYVEEPNYVMLLEHSYHTFSRQEIAASGSTTDRVKIIGYRNNSLTPVYIMDCGNDKEITSLPDGIPATSSTYDITGVTYGLSVSVSGNGTTDCYLDITITSAFTAEGGSLTIPVNVSSDFNVTGDTYGVWLMENETNSNKFGGTPSLFTTKLDYSFDVANDQVATSGYYLNLTNDSAGINCDSAGNVLSGAVRPTCSAQLWYGTQRVTGATFTGTTNQEAGATGVTVAADGQITFGSDFNFLGSQLEITVRCDYDGVMLTKIMNVSKQYPGADGTGATTRWLVLSKDEILFNPNTSGLTPSSINAKIMMQVNDEQPVEDVSTKLYYAWDLDEPTGITSYSGYSNTNITVIAGHSYLTVGLKNTQGVFYELESVPVIEQGMNGTSGESTYILQLSNQFDFVNVDASGTIVTGQASTLGTTAGLYYGSEIEPVDNATYHLVGNFGTGITIVSGTGVVSFTEGYANYFTGNSMDVTIQAKIGDIVYGEAKYKLMKNYPGTNGVDATRYWLVLSATAAHVDPVTSAVTPSSMTVSVNSQTGGNEPQTGVTGCTIKFGYDTINPQTNYSSGITIPYNKSYITVKLLKNNVQYDIQTIPIMKDGKEGGQGIAGAAIRGPYEWTGMEDRRFTSGSDSCNVDDGPYPEDYLFIDVIFRMSGNTKVYYRCVSSYTQVAETTWAGVQMFWQESDVSYDFVAADLILGNNGKINFLSGQEIYLLNSGGTVTGGARAADSANTIVFWAGGDESHLQNAAFKVYYDGSLEATKGKIGPWTISGTTGLEYNTYDGTENYRNSHLNTDEVSIWERTAGQTKDFTAGLNGIHYSASPEMTDGMCALEVLGGNVVFSESSFSVPSGSPKIYLDMPVRADYYDGNPVEFEVGIEAPNIDVASGITLSGGTINVGGSIFPSCLKVAYVTESGVFGNNFSNVGGTLYFNGDMNLGIPYSSSSSIGAGGMWYCNGNPTGVYYSADSRFTKRGDTIYITI